MQNIQWREFQVKKTIKAMWAMVLCITLLAFSPPATAFAVTTISNDAEEHILNQLRRARIPNAAIAVIQNGETSYIFRDSTHDTLFQIGSVAKSFTGFGVLLLEDMGLLSVYDPVNQHLPWFEARYNGVPVPHLTVYHLLQNSSGITNDERLFPMAAATESISDFIARLSLGIELEFYPSARHAYGNMNYILLGLIIEAVSGQSYDEFMTQQVFHPLGLHSTFANMERAHETGRVIGGNRLRFLQPVSWNPPIHPTSVPTGWIYSSVTDMVRWAGIHLGIVDVSEQFARVVHMSHRSRGSVDFFAFGNYFYTAGWNVAYGRERVRHNGATPGYSASLRIYPHNDMAVVVLGNLAHGAVPFGAFVTDVMDGEPFGSVRMEFFTIVDIVLTIVAISGIIYIGLLIRLFVKLAKRLRSGEEIRGSFTSKNIKWLLDPIFSIVGLAAVYIGPPIVANMSFEFVVMYFPASFAFAIIASWIGVVYSFSSFFAKVFGVIKTEKAKK